MSGVDLLAFFDDCIAYLSHQDNLAGYEVMQAEKARAAVAELIEQNQRLTKAVRAFADGEMSDTMRMRLFSASSDEPAKDALADLCTANDECEAALSRVRGAE